MIVTPNRKFLVGITVLATLAALPAFANGRRGFPGHGGPARGALNARGVLHQLIFPCPAACGDAAKTCIDTADSDALTCVSGACATEITTAQTACQADRSSENCHDAVDALVDCADSCLDTRADAVDVCRDALRDCRDACDSDQ